MNMIKDLLLQLSLILCMSFPASVGPGYRLDIRIIPLLMGTLYGGIRTGIILAALVILYRLYFGIDNLESPQQTTLKE